MTRLALFDCDGTLVDGQANHCMAMEAAFGKAGLTPLPYMETRRVIGLSLLESMRILAPEAEDARQRQMVEDYKAAFFEMRGRGEIEEPLYEGMRELLLALHKADWHLGVATGKSDRGLNNCLEYHGVKELFVSLQTADRHPSKPHPSMVHQAMGDAGVEASATIMIGDTSFDMEMGRNAGCRTIGVSWGYHPARDLLATGAEIVVDSIEELGAALEEMS